MTKNEFKTVIRSKTKWYDVNLKEVFAYKDLIFLLVKRNFTTRYKQTVLGPAWLVLSPLISTLISTFVFGTIAKIPSDGVPYFLFYMCGNTAWTYFAYCLNNTATTFTGNSAIFGKVYFPRLVMPISTVITGLLEFFINVVLFAAFWIYFKMTGAAIAVSWSLLLIPLLICQIALLGMGCGIIISSLTTKYRDLTILVGFGVSLWMYITPIIYSTSSLSPKGAALCSLNPMAPIVEITRYVCLGTGSLNIGFWLVSILETAIVLILGVLLFNRVEKTFMDTV